MIFIRVTGCNVRCGYCDTDYAFKEGVDIPMQDIYERIKGYPCQSVCITGGEPLLQIDELMKLVNMLKYWKYHISVETNGTIMFTRKNWPEVEKFVMDIKTPVSEIVFDYKKTVYNVQGLTQDDEIKFVVWNHEDVEFMVNQLRYIPKEIPVTISPVIMNLPKEYLTDDKREVAILKAISISLRGLIESVLEIDTGHDIRLLPQLHKIIWPDVKKGV